jgi:hypothetical protein
MSLTQVVLPLLPTGAGLVLIAGLAQLVRWQRRRRRVAPVAQSLERFPGQDLLARLETLSEEITIQVVTLLVLPTALYAIYISHLHFGALAATWVGVLGLVGLSGAFAAFSLVRLRRLLAERRNLRLGYLGEMAVGHALNRLMRSGFHVFHGFPAEGFDIDHVVVGVNGVFAVETRARAKPLREDGRRQAVVEYDGRCLRFPDGYDQEMVPQAQARAQWLSEWLSTAAGEPLAARAVLALPGWFVKRTSPEGLPVVNPGQFDSLFRHIPPRTLSPEQMARIVHQLEQKCRDVAGCSRETRACAVC